MTTDKLLRMLPLVLAGAGGVFMAHGFTLIGWGLLDGSVFAQGGFDA